MNDAFATQRQERAGCGALRLVLFFFCGTKTIPRTNLSISCRMPTAIAPFGDDKCRTIGGRKFNFAFLLSVDQIAPLDFSREVLHPPTDAVTSITLQSATAAEVKSLKNKLRHLLPQVSRQKRTPPSPTISRLSFATGSALSVWLVRERNAAEY